MGDCNTLKSFPNPRHCDPHLGQTKLNDLLPLTIDGVLIGNFIVIENLRKIIKKLSSSKNLTYRPPLQCGRYLFPSTLLCDISMQYFYAILLCNISVQFFCDLGCEISSIWATNYLFPHSTDQLFGNKYSCTVVQL